MSTYVQNTMDYGTDEIEFERFKEFVAGYQGIGFIHSTTTTTTKTYFRFG